LLGFLFYPEVGGNIILRNIDEVLPDYTVSYRIRNTTSSNVIQFLPHRKQDSVPVTQTNLLMLFREIINLYTESHTKYINTVCGANAEIFNVRAADTYN
jgi:hypothetical protein